MGGPGDPPRDCPPCKIIIDGGRFAAAARWLVHHVYRVMAADQSERDIAQEVAAAATYLADVVSANEEAISRGIKMRLFDAERIDQAHAWSELQCHRAQAIEDAIRAHKIIPAETLYLWAKEDRLHATMLAGGEYHGGWTVNGTDGITKKENG